MSVHVLLVRCVMLLQAIISIASSSGDSGIGGVAADPSTSVATTASTGNGGGIKASYKLPFSVVPGTGVGVHSAPFKSALSHVVWVGSSGFTCDQSCRTACLGAGQGVRYWDDAIKQQSEACVAGCGCAGGSQTVIVTTEQGEAFISTDAGTSWTDLRERVAQLQPKVAAGAQQTRVQQVHMSHAEPRNVVMLGTIGDGQANATAWVSNDAGNTWRTVKLSTPATGERRIYSWKWHPTMAGWALVETLEVPGVAAVSKSPAGGKKEQEPKKNPVMGPFGPAFYTQDAGASWQLLAENVEQCHWANRPGGDARRVVMTTDVQEGKHKRSQAQFEVIISEDFMASKTVLLGKSASGGPPAASQVLVHFGFIFAIARDASSASGRNLQLWYYSEAAAQVTKDMAATSKPAGGDGTTSSGSNAASLASTSQRPSFKLVRWPKGVAPTAQQLQRVEVLHSAEELAFLYMPSMDWSLPWGHIFSVNFMKSELALVLGNVHRPSPFEPPAWQAVSGVDGVFIANRVILDNGQNPDKVEKSFDWQASQVQEAEMVRRSEGDDADEGKPMFGTMTYVSYNMGASWQLLLAPHMNSHGTELPGCVGTGVGGFDGKPSSPCRLHLSRWTSSASAPGIIIGVGNAGPHLLEDHESHQVFISRNAGVSWEFSLDGCHTVAILAHGDALLAIGHHESEDMKFSLDGGHTWKDVWSGNRAADLTVAHQGIITHPAHTEFRAFAVFEGASKASATVLTSLDLEGVISDSCKLFEGPGSDFEKWSPGDALEDAQASKRQVCFQGVRTHYVRRKADHLCKTGVLRLAPVDFRKDEPCLCTATDYACDTGFQRSSYSAEATCEPIEGVPQPNVSEMCSLTIDEHVKVTRGYQIIPGNRCSGGVNLLPTSQLCLVNVGFRAQLRNFVLSHHFVVGGGICIAFLLSAHIVRRQFMQMRLSKSSIHKKYEDSRSANPDDDAAESEMLLSDDKI
eukprot:gnl/TRDRNA2_/TRDRNA2_92021_c0_seq1.p1 gnl/TRDRNA2_/TRDRNA2_92021_c0~~gnl/TRDRNA2_/TRDRNA2_92021_c0_seq1.p1  ORF type:complete len:971 (+),score=184.46 gnl/TRDRNA2_/TRDRNA2_92021_c0_seq1:28-2940(+)